MVDIDFDDESEFNFRKTLAAEQTKSLLLLEYQAHLKSRDLNSIVQISPDTIDITTDIAQRIKNFGGLGLFADYGSEVVNSDRLRGIKDHKLISPFSTPGKVDLSSDVEFSSIKITTEKEGLISLIEGISFFGPKTQRQFLLEMGMGHRVKMLLSNAKTNSAKSDLLQAVERLVSPDQMGNSYKFCALTRPGEENVPYGF